MKSELIAILTIIKNKKMMNRRLCLIVCLWAVVFTILPAQPQENGFKGPKPPHRPNPERFIQDKICFIVREMRLSAADSLRFVPIYKQLQKDKFLLMKQRTASTHDLRRRLSKSPDAEIQDSIYLKVVEDEYRYNIEDAQLESAYLEKFKKILSPRQLYSYSRAEKRFKSRFMNQNFRGREGDAKRKPDKSR